jgi:hypothetical protein
MATGATAGAGAVEAAPLFGRALRVVSTGAAGGTGGGATVFSISADMASVVVHGFFVAFVSSDSATTGSAL